MSQEWDDSEMRGRVFWNCEKSWHAASYTPDIKLDDFYSSFISFTEKGNELKDHSNSIFCSRNDSGHRIET